MFLSCQKSYIEILNPQMMDLLSRRGIQDGFMRAASREPAEGVGISIFTT